MNVTQPGSESEQANITTIKPASGWGFPDFRELWAFRELIYFLVLRDIKVRYRQTILGGLWAVIQPLAMSGVFTIVFGKVAGVPTEGVPYPLFAYTALVPWTLFSSVLSSSSGSLVGGANLISKVYFPRIIVPFASAVSFLSDFAIGLALLVIFLVFYGVVPPTPEILLLPFFSLMALLSAFAMGIWLSALNVKYRDIRYAVPFLLQLLVFASPLGYPVTEIQGPARIFYAINPVTGIAEGFRWVVLGLDPPPLVFLIVPTIGTFVLLITGVLYFRRSERIFADLI
jgi:homopolymeric O-antigen transport system permease protein